MSELYIRKTGGRFGGSVYDKNGDEILGGASATDHAALSNLDYASSGHTGFEPTVTKGNLTTSTTGLAIAGGTGSVIGSGAQVNADTGYGIPTTTKMTNWDTAYGWGNHASAGYLSSEADTLGTVTGRGASTSTESTFSGGLISTQVKANSSAGVAVKANNGDSVALLGAGGGQNATFYGGVKVESLTASKVVFTDASKNLTSTGIGTSSQFIKADGSLDSSTYLTSTHDPVTVSDTDTVDLTLSTQQISAAVRTQMSITSDSSGVKLSGDSASPGNSYYYGTNSSGTKGYHTLPSGGDTWLKVQVFS